MIKKMRHIGIIVEDFDRAIKKFEGFGLTCNEVTEKKEEGIKIAFFPIGDTLIEFLSLSADKGWDPVHTAVRSQKGALNHLCFEVDDLEASIRDFEKNGAKLIEGCPMAGAHGRVAFFYPETTEGALIELCEV
ncbi:VOC family protein [Chloroflexota bacterium]